MAISDPNIKRLWGKAAGRCSFPGCNQDCLVHLTSASPTIIGEMAHVIAKSKGGPRGASEDGSDEYVNLILLCPSHHRLIDKAPPDSFSEETLLRWKHEHEKNVDARLKAPSFGDRVLLNQFVSKLLIENHACWSVYGPEGSAAKTNLNSELADIWAYRKLSLLAPNNRSIISAIRSNSGLFSAEEYAVCCLFFEHAEGFERNTIKPIEGVPRFPPGFKEIFNEKRI